MPWFSQPFDSFFDAVTVNILIGTWVVMGINVSLPRTGKELQKPNEAAVEKEKGRKKKVESRRHNCLFNKVIIDFDRPTEHKEHSYEDHGQRVTDVVNNEKDGRVATKDILVPSSRARVHCFFTGPRVLNNIPPLHLFCF